MQPSQLRADYRSFLTIGALPSSVTRHKNNGFGGNGENSCVEDSFSLLIGIRNAAENFGEGC